MGDATKFNLAEAEAWKRSVDDLVARVESVLNKIEQKIKEKLTGDSIAEAVNGLCDKVQSAFKKLIECIKKAVQEFVNVINRMRQAWEDIKQGFTNAGNRIKNA